MLSTHDIWCLNKETMHVVDILVSSCNYIINVTKNVDVFYLNNIYFDTIFIS